MSFLDIKFPDDISYGCIGGPVYKTDHKTPVYEYTADLQRLDGHLAKQLQAFFQLTKGALHSFRFKDWLDYSALDAVIGTGTGVLTQFQLQKTYQIGVLTDTRIITKPVSGTVTAKINDTPTSLFTIDTSTGIITFSSPPAAGDSVTASFEFDVPVRFAQDSLPISLNNTAGYDIPYIRLIEAT